PEDVMRMEIFIEGKDAPVTTFAEIKWIKKNEQEKSFGVEFLILKESDKEVIRDIIEGE
ncbi:MAG TPA: PilZ domain-containing protein, partial [Firmicutes bacterium]|nr:PilZ domain-containing protein [Bacillota bacterium]